MGAGAAGAWPAAAMIGSSLISSLSMPEGQELQSFEGSGATDPLQMFSDGRIRIEDMIRLLQDRANQPVTLRRAYVQQPPVFTGGGLPMPIGMVGQDPALADPSLLTLPGLAGQGNSGPIHTPGQGGPPGVTPVGPNAPPVDPNAPPESGPYGARYTGQPQRRRLPSVPSMQMLNSPRGSAEGGDDLMQGRGAVELLLRSMMPGPANAATTQPF